MNKRLDPPFDTRLMKSSFITFVLKIFMSGLTSDGTVPGVTSATAVGTAFVPSINDSLGSMDEDLEVLFGVLGCKYGIIYISLVF